jgi:Type VI secretion system effector, Hcp
MQFQPQQRSSKEPTTTEVANELTPEELGKVSAGTFNGFLSFGDIKGESTDKDHKDWIEVSSFQHKR